jgi:iron complex outermembrane recepter protein
MGRVLMLVGLLSTAAAARAEEVEDERRGDVVVTAQRTKQVAEDARVGILGNSDVFATPFNAKAYTADLIRDQAARNVNDIVANDPSIRVSLSPSFPLDQSSIRGFLVVGGAYLFDNLPNLTPNYGTMPIAHFERVDIFKGPASALTAAIGSVGGIINLAPKRALDRRIASATVAGYTGALIAGHVDLGQRFGRDGMFGVRVNVSGETGEFVDGSTRRQWVPTVALDARAGPVRAFVDAGYIEYVTRGQGLNFALAPGAQLPRVPDPRRSIVPRWAFFHDRSWFALGQAELDVATGWTLFGRYGQSGQRMRSVTFATAPIDSAGGVSPSLIGVRPWRNDETIAEAGLRGAFATGPLGHKIVVSALRGTGGNSEFGNVAPLSLAGLPRGSIYAPYPLANPFPNGLPPFSYIDAPQPRLESVAVADDVSLLDDRIRLILSARQQRIVQQPYDQSRLTPTVALLAKPTSRLSLYANYAEALTQGAVAPANAVNAGEQLPPYVSRQYEVGAKWNGGGYGVTLAYFDTRQDFALLTPANRFELGGQQRNRGIELETFGEPVKGLRVLGGAAWIDAVQNRTATGATTGNKALGVPEWTVNLGLEHDLAALPGLTLAARYIHTGESFIDLRNTQLIPAWNRVDASARYAFSVGGTALTTRAGVTNLFDGRYWSTGGRNLFVIAQPRTWFTSVSVDL